jgi:OOP family OmpA-OmpF porin
MKKLLSIVLFTALSTTAMAEGLYVAVDIGDSTAKDACASLGSSCTDSGTAYRLGAGLQFTPNLGIVASYAIMGKVKASGFLGNAEFKPQIMQVSATGKFPISGTFSLIGNVGLARTTVDLSAYNSFGSYSPSAATTKLAWGVGAQYDFANRLGIRAQYEDFGEVGDANTTGTAKLSMISAGLVVKF